MTMTTEVKEGQRHHAIPLCPSLPPSRQALGLGLRLGLQGEGIIRFVFSFLIGSISWLILFRDWFYFVFLLVPLRVLFLIGLGSFRL